MCYQVCNWASNHVINILFRSWSRGQNQSTLSRSTTNIFRNYQRRHGHYFHLPLDHELWKEGITQISPIRNLDPCRKTFWQDPREIQLEEMGNYVINTGCWSISIVLTEPTSIVSSGHCVQLQELKRVEMLWSSRTAGDGCDQFLRQKVSLLSIFFAVRLMQSSGKRKTPNGRTAAI